MLSCECSAMIPRYLGTARGIMSLFQRTHMRLVSGFAVITTGLILFNVYGCRPKAKRAPAAHATAAVSSIASGAPLPVQPPNLRYFQSKPIDLEALTPIRTKAKAAFQQTLDRHTGANDSMVALARVLSEAPGSGVIAIELAKTAQRTRDRNRLARYLKIVERATAAFPVLAKPANTIARTGAADQRVATSPGLANPSRLNGVKDLGGVCGWLLTSFKEGRPPVGYVGEQDTQSLDCQISPTFALTPDLEAATAIVRTGKTDERVFAWVALRYQSSLWLSALIAESFAPSMHPYGNGFSVELQRTEAYRGALPEIVAYVTERSTVLDVVLGEMVVLNRNRSVVTTFDSQSPQSSPNIVLYSKLARSLIDPSDAQPPKGYKHSRELGRTTEESLTLEWGDNQVRLAPRVPGQAGSRLIALFTEP